MALASTFKIPSPSATPGLDELLKARKESNVSQVSDPLNMVEMALEIQVERARANEAIAARDATVQRLSDAYVSVRQKISIIEQLRQAPPPQDTLASNVQIAALQMTIKTLREELTTRKQVPAKSLEPPPSYDENDIDHTNPGHNPQLVGPSSQAPLRVPRDAPPLSRQSSQLSAASAVPDGNDLDYQVQITLSSNSFIEPPFQAVRTVPKSSEPEDIIRARHALLAKIPLPDDPPDDTLKPIVIPAPFTLHEFLANATGSLRTALSNYRVLQELTTSWCPEREEHGYLLTPLFKCSTNPRVATAHRWNMVDVMARMSKPTECFYNKDGNWYYAGIYKAFRLDDLTVKEWDALSAETAQALIKDTITGRKNTSPQNIYETSQLYAAGALKVACLGLQCVGFNKTMYRTVLEQAAKCALAGKWKAAPGAAVGGTWNAAGEVVEGGGVTGVIITGNENTPVQSGKARK